MNRQKFMHTLGILSLGSVLPIQALQQLKFGKSTQKFPVFFFGHGSPMNAIEENKYVEGWRKAVAHLEQPQAILCISAHWLTKGTKITAMESPETIHDFGGFPQALFDVQYPAKGDSELAQHVAHHLNLSSDALDQEWGLDHGTWSVLRQIFPLAQVPVLQLSIDYQLSHEQHLALGAQLEALRSRGVLLVGSGNLVHNLSEINWSTPDDGTSWAIEAQTGISKALKSKDLRFFKEIDKMGVAYKGAIPTPDHYWPALYALAAMGKDELQMFNEYYAYGSLSMHSFRSS
ncbi:MAG: 4,5-DOPA dioxygenase extradiol [Bacteroidota bacterium]|jgi:4,5-DOPA dioxygenase extradiol